MPLSTGEKLGPYEILAPIGAGGMGEVYRAKDTRLGREVAVKVSAQQFTERFERESRAIASLNHTNVCHLYDVGPNYLVMEYVEGETLSGPVKLAEAMPIIRQLIDGIEAAHERNIIHRDLKPANIKITPEGVVKILDFGLAKASSPEPEGTSDNSPTVTMGATTAGTILGTAAYMSPEQAKGKTADKRSDIWSFGVVVYELLTGKKPFDGESVVETLGAVINKEPDWSAVPERVRRLLQWCLEKERKRRLQSIGDARRTLEETPAVQTARSESRLLLPVAIAASVFAAALGVVSFIHFREQPPAAEVTRFEIPLPAGASFPGPFIPQEISPDGRKLAFVASDASGVARLWVRPLDSLEARPLAGAELSLSPLPFFWSPDSRFLAFNSSDRKLKKIDISGGPAQTLCDSGDVDGGAWSPEGVLLFGGVQTPITRCPETGGTPVALTQFDPARQEIVHGNPRFLPDGHHFLYFRASTVPGNAGFYVGSIDAKPAEQPSQPLLVNQTLPAYYVPAASGGSSGTLLFFRDGSVLAQPFNAAKLQPSGEAVPIAAPVSSLPNFQGCFSASANGVLAFVSGANGEGDLRQLTWLDRQGKKLGTVGEPAIFTAVGRMALSPDGKQAAVTRAQSVSALGSLWLYDLTGRDAPARFTLGSSLDLDPVYSPDSSRIAFLSTRDGGVNLYQKLTNGTKNDELLLKSDAAIPYSWSPDGRFLAYGVRSRNRGGIWLLPMSSGGAKPVEFQGTEFDEGFAQFSPDGHWIAYESDQSGTREIYVRELILGSDGKPEETQSHVISAGGGVFPSWKGDSKELFYLTGDQKTVRSVEITAKPVFQRSATTLNVPLPAGATFGGVARDGLRFLIALPVGQGNRPQQFTIVQNWPAGSKK